MSLEEYKLYSIPLYSLFIKDKLLEFFRSNLQSDRWNFLKEKFNIHTLNNDDIMVVVFKYKSKNITYNVKIYGRKD